MSKGVSVTDTVSVTSRSQLADLGQVQEGLLSTRDTVRREDGSILWD